MIYVFTKNGEKVPPLPSRPGLQFKHIKFDSTALEDLMLVAKYRVINFPTSIIVDGRGQVLMKVKGTIPDSYVDSLLESN
jgi:thioredoxin-related protein